MWNCWVYASPHKRNGSAERPLKMLYSSFLRVKSQGFGLWHLYSKPDDQHRARGEGETNDSHDCCREKRCGEKEGKGKKGKKKQKQIILMAAADRVMAEERRKKEKEEWKGKKEIEGPCHGCWKLEEGGRMRKTEWKRKKERN